MITKKDLEHIGWLARLELSEEDKEKYTPKLNSVLDYFGELDKADTEGVEPSYHVMPMSNVFREDVPTAIVVAGRSAFKCPEEPGWVHKGSKDDVNGIDQ